MNTIAKLSLAILVLLFCSCQQPSIKGDVELTEQKEKNLKGCFIEFESSCNELLPKMFAAKVEPNLLIVDFTTNEVFSSQQNKSASLFEKDYFYAGLLEKAIDKDQKVIEWDGQNFALLSYPMSKSKRQRKAMISAAAVKLGQINNGFEVQNTDEIKSWKDVDYRVLHRLELNALQTALKSESDVKQSMALKHALKFRKYRESRFPKFKAEENSLDLTRGIEKEAYYRVQYASINKLRARLAGRISKFQKTGKSIEKCTEYSIPSYCLLMNLRSKEWKKKITSECDFSALLYDSFEIKNEVPKKMYIDRIGRLYGRSQIIGKENSRQKNI